MEENEVRSIFAGHGLPCIAVRKLTGSFGKELFIVDNAWLLRTSARSMEAEIAKNRRVQGLSGVPGIIAFGNTPTFYLLLELIPGRELYGAFGDLNSGEQARIGRDVSLFLDRLHAIRGERYDIGHYLPIVPASAGSWKTGHLEYLEYIEKGLSEAAFDAEGSALAGQGLGYIRSHADSLDYEGGPRLLHNDFHPKNIIVNGSAFSGIIDWECSQFGEADFDLAHLVHWCLFPPPWADAPADSRVFTLAALGAQAESLKVPRLAERLTIYLVEHDLLQIGWSGGKRNAEYFPRLRFWLSGGVAEFLGG